ncbi:MAG: hypothetical protein ABIL69_11180, partial [candidate division WOR-3 bacterium]
KWIDGYIFNKKYELNLKNAKRLLGKLLNFYKFLVQRSYTEREKSVIHKFFVKLVRSKIKKGIK